MTDVSVIIPIYNTSQYLHRCIKSILTENKINVEIILINDGSTDTSGDICRYYRKCNQNIIYIEKRNEGQGTARNIGIEIAKSKYLYFLDSDDYLENGFFCELVRLAETYELDICSPSIPPYYYQKGLEYVAALPTRSQFIRSSLIKKYNIRQPSSISGQDGVFSHVVLLHSYRFGVSKKAICHYTERADSTFSSNLRDHNRVIDIIKSHYDFLTDYYDVNHLWEFESIRLAQFFEYETLRNRIIPHWNFLDIKSQGEIVDYLSKNLCGIAKFISKNEFTTLSKVAINFLTTGKLVIDKNYSESLKSIVFPKQHNIFTEEYIIVKFDESKKNTSTFGCKEVLQHAEDMDDNMMSNGKTLINIEHKLDFCINTINNASIQYSLIPQTNQLDESSNIVVTMTTIESRLGTLHLAIESIFRQSVLPKYILLYISDKININRKLTAQLNHQIDGGLIIKQVEDIGAHTKLYYALQDFPNSTLITIDDDIIYPSNMIHYLYSQSKIYPKSIIGNWVRLLKFDKRGLIRPIREGQLLTPPTLQYNIEQNKTKQFSSLYCFPYGTGGVLYPPQALHKEVFNINMLKELCPVDDDIWFKSMSILNNTTAAFTSLGINPSHHTVTGSQLISLRHNNHDTGKHEKQLIDVFNYYDLYTKLKREPYVWK